ncbi:MAG: hypothetical protein ACYDG2_23930 [Ruminiclostridium sp.]
MNILKYLVDHKEWIFDGIGISIIGVLIGIIKMILNKKKSDKDKEDLKKIFSRFNKRNLDLNKYTGLLVSLILNDSYNYQKKDKKYIKAKENFGYILASCLAQLNQITLEGWTILSKLNYVLEKYKESQNITNPSEYFSEEINELNISLEKQINLLYKFSKIFQNNLPKTSKEIAQLTLAKGYILSKLDFYISNKLIPIDFNIAKKPTYTIYDITVNEVINLNERFYESDLIKIEKYISNNNLENNLKALERSCDKLRLILVNNFSKEEIMLINK